ncbi:hypothetical protein FHX79_111768 [Streptomyces cavourensis]|nr:hypothetical protein FHX79_111768 [Streptomyces cavourensis]
MHVGDGVGVGVGVGSTVGSSGGGGAVVGSSGSPGPGGSAGGLSEASGVEPGEAVASPGSWSRSESGSGDPVGEAVAVAPGAGGSAGPLPEADGSTGLPSPDVTGPGSCGPPLETEPEAESGAGSSGPRGASRT